VDTSGWEASVNYHWNNWLGLKADFDGHYCCDGAKMHDFLFGPQITFGHGELSPYVHGLAGVSHGTQAGFTDTVLAYAVGGGLDVKITDRVSWRLAQADYFGTRYADATQHDFRLSTGLVFRFWKK
jgi:opacity protein-like surface antigen